MLLIEKSLGNITYIHLQNWSIMEHKQLMVGLALFLVLIGDIFYLGSFFFRDAMIGFIVSLSTEFSAVDFDPVGENMVLIFTSLMGAMLYLVAFLAFALGYEEKKRQRDFAYYGVIVWFIADSFASYYFHIEFNILINLVFLLVATIVLKFVKVYENAS